MNDSLGGVSGEMQSDALDLTQVIELIQQVRRFAHSYGIIVEVVTRSDVEEVWKARQAESSVEQHFTDEMWGRFRETYAWHKGLSLTMWDGVWERIHEGLSDIEDPNFGRIM